MITNDDNVIQPTNNDVHNMFERRSAEPSAINKCCIFYDLQSQSHMSRTDGIL
jgi:hypothetical protein